MLDGEDGGAASRLISVNPTLRRQAEAMLPALEQAKVKATDEEAFCVLVRHTATYAMPPRSDASWRELFDVYLDALDGFSVFQIEDAFRRWNRGEDMKDPAMGQFFPKPAQLVHLAKKSKAEVWMAAWRARKALETAERTVPRELSQDERKAVADGLRALADTFKVKGLPDDMKLPMSPAEVADKLRQMAPDESDDLVL